MPVTFAVILPDGVACLGFCFLLWCSPVEIYYLLAFCVGRYFIVLQEVLNSWTLATKCHKTGFVMVTSPNTPTHVLEAPLAGCSSGSAFPVPSFPYLVFQNQDFRAASRTSRGWKGRPSVLLTYGGEPVLFRFMFFFSL